MVGLAGFLRFFGFSCFIMLIWNQQKPVKPTFQPRWIAAVSSRIGICAGIALFLLSLLLCIAFLIWMLPVHIIVVKPDLLALPPAQSPTFVSQHVSNPSFCLFATCLLCFSCSISLFSCLATAESAFLCFLFCFGSI